MLPDCGQTACCAHHFCADFRLCRIPVNTCTSLQSLIKYIKIPLERAVGTLPKTVRSMHEKV